jgi:hypothetical protein
MQVQSHEWPSIMNFLLMLLWSVSTLETVSGSGVITQASYQFLG